MLLKHLFICMFAVYHSIFIVKQRFLSSFQICIPFILLSWHIALARTSVMMLKGWLREDILALYLILVGKLWIYHLAQGFLWIVSMKLRKFLSFLFCWGILSCVLDFVKSLSASIDMIMWFFLFSLLMWWLLNFWMLN